MLDHMSFYKLLFRPLVVLYCFLNLTFIFIFFVLMCTLFEIALFYT